MMNIIDLDKASLTDLYPLAGQKSWFLCAHLSALAAVHLYVKYVFKEGFSCQESTNIKQNETMKLGWLLLQSLVFTRIYLYLYTWDNYARSLLQHNLFTYLVHKKVIIATKLYDKRKSKSSECSNDLHLPLSME